MVKQTEQITRKKNLVKRARQVKLLITDVDGVLTDTGVYYSASGEELKRFSLRDGMGVELLRKQCGIETAIVTGENSEIVRRRAEKLKIDTLYMGIKDKARVLYDIMESAGLVPEEIAYIGDDVNDSEVLELVGFSACPKDAMPVIKHKVLFTCNRKGGHGAFREVADFIITAQLNYVKEGKDYAGKSEDR